MKFYINNKPGVPTLNLNTLEQPSILLNWDNWNDYSFCTQFQMYLYDNNTSTYISDVKIAFTDELKKQFFKTTPKVFEENGYLFNYNYFIPNEFEKLPNGFFSLGHLTYYETLRKLSNDLFRETILDSLNDLAFKQDLAAKLLYESEPIDVIDTSLLRGINILEVKNQLHRVANGGVTLDHFNFQFDTSKFSRTDSIDFSVVPESLPPSNLHAIIGSNGAGKSFLLSHIAQQFFLDPQDLNQSNTQLGLQELLNLIVVSFSPFDRILDYIQNKKYTYVGLRNSLNNVDGSTYKTRNVIEKEFLDYVYECHSNPSKKERWAVVTLPLESDYFFKNIQLSQLLNQQKCPIKGSQKYEEVWKPHFLNFFKSLGSGHRIIILTIVALIDSMLEKTLVLFDEPETYLHPPLLASFIRAMSILATYRNGVVIIATHSPVVLQELPQNCVWKASRYGTETVYARPSLETFGENVSILNREIFNLEIEHAGFVAIIDEIIDEVLESNIFYYSTELEYVFYTCLSKLNNQLGSEGQIILLSKLKNRMEEYRNV